MTRAHGLSLGLSVPAASALTMPGILIYKIAMATQAYLCGECGWADKATECVKCGKPFANVPAQLCDSCGWGNKATECIKCGKPFAEVPAQLCDSCGWGNKATECVKCDSPA
jgi:ribosomal protein L37E